MNVILKTARAIYSPCRIISSNDQQIIVTYFAGMKRDPETKRMVEDHKINTIPRSDIISLQERT